MKKAVWICFFAFITLAIFLLLSPEARPFIIVNEREAACFFRDGKLTKLIEKPGIYWKYSFLNKVKIISLKSKQIEFELPFLNDGDIYFYNVKAAGVYKINNADKFARLSPELAAEIPDSLSQKFNDAVKGAINENPNLKIPYIFSDQYFLRQVLDGANHGMIDFGVTLVSIKFISVEYTPLTLEYITEKTAEKLKSEAEELEKEGHDFREQTRNR